MHSLRVREHPIEGPYVQGIKILFSLRKKKIQCVFLSLCNEQFMQFYLEKKELEYHITYLNFARFVQTCGQWLLWY